MSSEHLVYNIDVVANTSDLSRLESQLKGAFGSLKGSLPAKALRSYENSMNKIAAQVKVIQNLEEKGGTSKQYGAAFKELEKELNNIQRITDSVNSGSIKLKVDSTSIKSAEENLERVQQEASKGIELTFKNDTGLQSSLNEVNSKVNELTSNWKGKTGQLAADIASNLSKGTSEGFAAAQQQMNSLRTNLKRMFVGIKFDSGTGAITSESSEEKINFKGKTENAEKLRSIYSDLVGIIERVNGAQKDYDNSVKQAEADLEKVKNTSNNMKMDQFSKIGDQLNNARSGVDALGSSLVNTQAQFEAASNSASMLITNLEYFFSAQEAINLFKRGVSDAVDTIKELDASMTETAVVTNFSVGDMWNQLPTYTKTAQELGTTIKDVYDATALYYQQGLNTNQSMGIATETLKMARIAGMDASDATDAMTSSLRGFNMELNQSSAQRIDDVYSKLAQITASDTQEISTAMSKTASLASQAGMDVEQTATLLAKMIETTRESPEL